MRTITGHSGRGAVGEAFDPPEELQRWLLSCPLRDDLPLARGNRSPLHIEATPEEPEAIEWRPGRRRWNGENSETSTIATQRPYQQRDMKGEEK